MKAWGLLLLLPSLASAQITEYNACNGPTCECWTEPGNGASTTCPNPNYQPAASFGPAVASVPEIATGSAGAALMLLAGALAISAARRRFPRAERT